MNSKLFSSGQKGFTLIEALIAVFILSMGIIPSFSLVLISGRLATSIKNNLIAANLAQEGIEVVRAMRDTNWLNGSAFDSGLGDGVYRVVWDSTSLLPEAGNPPLKLDPSGFYNYSTGDDTIFSRSLTITEIDPGGCGCELRVVSEVQWSESKATRNIKIESHLFDWR